MVSSPRSDTTGGAALEPGYRRGTAEWVGQEGKVFGVALSPDGTQLAAVGDRGTVSLWNPISRQQLAVPLSGHEGTVRDVAFRPDGQLLATAGFDGTVRLWDPEMVRPWARP